MNAENGISNRIVKIMRKCSIKHLILLFSLVYDYGERMLCEMGIYHYVILSDYGESIFLIDRFPRRFSELARSVFDENDVRVFGVSCCHDLSLIHI